MFTEWDEDLDYMKISCPGNVFEFTVGSSIYKVNGTSYQLGYKIHETDGVPMLPLNKIADELGLKLEYTDVKYAVIK